MTTYQRLLAAMDELDHEVEEIERALGLAKCYQGCETCGQIYLGTTKDPCPSCGTRYDRPEASPRQEAV